MQKTKGKANKGITLIALVITIIILIILAGVSINLVLGENGILSKAQTAKKEIEEGEKEEQVILAQAEANMNDKETEYAGIKIPAGMAPTRAKGENTVKEGLVAVDKNGNEWVWIEVPKSKMPANLTFSNKEDYNTLTTALKEYANPYCTQGNSSPNYEWKDEFKDDAVVQNATGLTSEQYEELKEKMLRSVYENGGFWIGRYEAGIEGSTGTDEGSLAKARLKYASIDSNSPKAICQKDAIPYNFIRCREAEKLASAMSPDESKTSSLMFGIQWDLVCKFLEEKSDLESEDINKDSKDWGNFKNVSLTITSNKAKVYITNNIWSSITGNKLGEKLLSTGASEQTKKLNIYDFAGNGWEWTLEHATIKEGVTDSEKSCCVRGGNYTHTSNDSMAVSRARLYGF